MDKNEKMLLLEILLMDIRGNWGWEDNDRAGLALKLAEELELDDHVQRINTYLNETGWRDGRHFRTSFSNGGYLGMDSQHDLESTYYDKSDEFKQLADDYLTYPETLFEDFR